MEKMTKTEMVEALVAHYTHGNKAKFSAMIGVSPQTVSAWVARNTFDYELLYTKCSGINPVWLLTGEGDMLLNNNGTTIVNMPYNNLSIDAHHNSQHIGQGISPEAYQALQAENKELRDKLDAMTQRYADLSDKFLVLLNKI